MTITFSGLATGLETADIIDSLIEVESAPITTMENQIEYLETKQDTFEEFDSLLNTLSYELADFNSENDLYSYSVNNSGSSYFTVEASSTAVEGSYSVEVVSLAARQKDVASETFDDSDTTLLSGEITIGDETISYENVTLSGLAKMINEGDYGLTASVIDQGSDTGYRLMFTADTSGDEIDIVGTGDVTIDTATDGHTVAGSLAHITIDGIDYYSSSNTITDSNNGLTYTLNDVSEEGADTVTVTNDTESAMEDKISAIVEAYNAINTYVTTIYESDSSLGLAMKSVSTKIKDYLTDQVFVNLGISSDWETGDLSFDSTVLAEAYEEDPDGVLLSLFGDDENTGFMTLFDDYLATQTNSSTGFLATKNDTIETKIDRLDEAIERMETRLESRRETLEAQFTAMETLVATLNSTGDYLTSFFENYTTSSS